MRFHEFINESSGLGEMIEDEAETRGDAVLVTALEELRSRAHGHAVPRVRVDSLVNLIRRLPGGEMFNNEALDAARKSNEAVKNLIADIKDDENGTKYVYLTPYEDDPFGDETDATGSSAKTAPEKTVSSMADRALGKR
jgi:hypothetical protein